MDAFAFLAAHVMTLGCIAFQPAYAQAEREKTPPAVLESEVATTVSLRPLQAHDLMLGHSDGVRIIDGDTAKSLARVYTPKYSNFAIAPDNSFMYIAESFWARGNRGPREDLLAIYDMTKLDLVAEIKLPGRLISEPKTHNFHLSADGRYAYVYNFQPASSIIVVDLAKRKVVDSVEIPGCAQVMPWGARGLAALCADGAMAIANVDAKGKYSVKRTDKFFDVDNDPVFDESVLDRQNGEAFLISYTGLIYSVKLGDTPQIAKPWSVQQAAGFSPATTKIGHETWRPSGNRLAAYHRASGRLFLLMHVGVHWDYAKAGTEVWVLDVRQQKVITRLALPMSARNLAVTQDAEPLLFAMGDERLWVLNPNSGDVLRTTHMQDASLTAVRDF